MAVIRARLVRLVFATLNMPSSGDGSGRFAWHGASLLMHTCLIAFAGITAHARLLHYVRESRTQSSRDPCVFRLVGGESICRGTGVVESAPVFCVARAQGEFLRDDPFNGNFYEAVIVALKNVSNLEKY